MTKEELKNQLEGVVEYIPKKAQMQQLLFIVNKYTKELEKERDQWKETASKHQ